MYVFIKGSGLHNEWSFNYVKHAYKVKVGIKLEFTEKSGQKPFLLKGKYLRILEINND